MLVCSMEYGDAVSCTKTYLSCGWTRHIIVSWAAELHDTPDSVNSEKKAALKGGAGTFLP